MKYLITLVFLLGCQTAEKPESYSVDDLIDANGCPLPVITEYGGAKFNILNEEDAAAFNTAKKHCVKWYPKSPCLKVFQKRPYGAYRATCGGKHEQPKEQD